MPEDPVKFPANLPYRKWPDVSNIFSLMMAGDWVGAKAYFAVPAQHDNITDAIGAGNYWRAQFTPPQPVVVPTNPASIGFETLPWLNSSDGQINMTTVTEDGGKVSCSAGSGGAVCWVSLDPTFPLDDKLTSTGTGSTGYIYPAKGQAFYFMQTTYPTQRMRASMERR